MLLDVNAGSEADGNPKPKLVINRLKLSLIPRPALTSRGVHMKRSRDPSSSAASSSALAWATSACSLALASACALTIGSRIAMHSDFARSSLCNSAEGISSACAYVQCPLGPSKKGGIAAGARPSGVRCAGVDPRSAAHARAPAAAAGCHRPPTPRRRTPSRAGPGPSPPRPAAPAAPAARGTYLSLSFLIQPSVHPSV